MIQKIATQAVYVDDQNKAKEFWTQKIGFEVKAEFPMTPDANWLEVGPKGADSNLVLYPKEMMKDWHQKNPSIVFQCDDCEKTYEILKEKGVNFISEPKKMEWGTFATFEDLDKNQFLVKS